MSTRYNRKKTVPIIKLLTEFEIKNILATQTASNPKMKMLLLDFDESQ